MIDTTMAGLSNPEVRARVHSITREIVIRAIWDKQEGSVQQPLAVSVGQYFEKRITDFGAHFPTDIRKLVRDELKWLGYEWGDAATLAPAVVAVDCIAQETQTQASDAQDANRKPDPARLTLLLTNGYPSPWLPEYGGTPEQIERGADNPYAMEACATVLQLDGVVHVEHKHVLTVTFADVSAYEIAKRLTGWQEYDAASFVLEARTSTDEGYDHPAILADVEYELAEGFGEGTTPRTAYCGYQVFSE